MRRAVFVMIAGIAGCSSSADDLDDFTWQIDGTSEVPIDRIELYKNNGPTSSLGPITPGRRARGELADELAQTTHGYVDTRELEGDTQFELTTSSALLPSGMVAVGYRDVGDGSFAVVAAGDVQSDGATQFLTVRLTVAMATRVEVWGDGEDLRCLRIADQIPRYMVAYDDQDCDGLATVADCNDADHCALDAPTAAERGGCTTDRCQPCLDKTPGACAIGTHVVCTDDGTGWPDVTCDSSPTCGAATCLPESTCALRCGEDWPTSDPRGCIGGVWDSGTANADAIVCALPARRHAIEGLELLCEGGSVVEVALPYAACSNPQVAIGGNQNAIAAVTITPPCTMRLALTPTQPVETYTRGVLVTFDTAGTSASARLELVPTVDTCGTTGACAAVPVTATCAR